MDRSVGDTINNLANQLLTRARAQHGIATPAFEELDLAKVRARGLPELGTGAVARRIALGFEVEHAVPLRADPTLIRELVKNLVDNAIRYTPEGWRVTVRMSAPARRRPSRSRTAAKAWRRPPGACFEPFHRSRPAASRAWDWGLSIVRDIARAHGADIDLADGSGESGSRCGCASRAA